MRRLGLIYTCVMMNSSFGLQAAGQDSHLDLVFMRPIDVPVTKDSPDDAPAYSVVTDRTEQDLWRGRLRNESAERALRLVSLAYEVAADGTTDAAPPAYHIALVPQGNHADRGFLLVSENATQSHPETPYIKLDPSPRAFAGTFLHESGHVILAVLAGDGIPAESMASIPHTTSALTDRGTAFNEGFSIYLEALAAHMSDQPDMRRQYRHERVVFGSDDFRADEYFHHAIDLRNYAQTRSRYYDVRENNYAFQSAHREPDYLRVQLDKSRDFARLRDANQLLQSEGFYASFFFAFTVRGDGRPDEDVIEARQRRLFEALAVMLRDEVVRPESPHLLRFVETYMQLFPDEATVVVDALLDLSHGVFVDSRAAELWSRCYDAALRLDIAGFPPPELVEARAQWRDAVLDDPSTLYGRIGPQIRAQVDSVTVTLIAFGRPMPLSFDVNTVQEGVIRLIPGITDEIIDRWLNERAERPFADSEDFTQRVGPGDAWINAVSFDAAGEWESG